jgi:hypothetical protein
VGNLQIVVKDCDNLQKVKWALSSGTQFTRLTSTAFQTIIK